MKRFVLLEDQGKPLLSTSAAGHPVVRCEAPGLSIEMRLGETRLRENLATYYQAEGRLDRFRIVIEEDQYEPRLRASGDLPAAARRN